MQENHPSLDVKIALLEDSISDLAKIVEEIDQQAQVQKDRGTKMLICTLSCVAAIIAAILQGILSSQ